MSRRSKTSSADGCARGRGRPGRCGPSRSYFFRFSPLRPRWYLLEFQHVSFGIANIDGHSHAARPVANRRLPHHLDPFSAQEVGQLPHIPSLDSEAYVVHVAALLRSLGGRHEVYYAASGAQLDKSDLLDASFLGKSQDSDIKGERALDIAASKHHVIQLDDFDRLIHRRTPRYFPRRIPFAREIGTA